MLCWSSCEEIPHVQGKRNPSKPGPLFEGNPVGEGTYCLTWVSLTLDVEYLFTAAPAKRSHCSLPWMRGISSLPPFLTFNVGAGRLSGTVSPFRAEQGTSLETPSRRGTSP